MSYRALFFLLIFLSLPIQIGAQFLPKSGVSLEQNRISSIRLDGQKHIDENLILRKIGLDEGASYHPSVLKDKIRSGIEELHGSGLFSDVEILGDYQGNGDVGILVRLVEKPVAGRVIFEGHEEYIEEDLDPLVSILPGQSYGQADLERYRQKILAKYREDGYLLAQVSIREEYDDVTGRFDLVYRILEGKKLVVSDIQIHGNEKLDSEGIIDAMASEIDHWYSDGEYKEEQFATDLDSVLAHYKSYGYLDAKIIDSQAEYLPDSSFHLYLGSVNSDSVPLPNLLGMVNSSLRDYDHPLSEVSRLWKVKKGGYFRRFNSQEAPQVGTVQLENEEEFVAFFNKTLNLRSLREVFLKNFSKYQTWEDDSLKMLLAKKEITDEFEQRYAVRHIFEEVYPVVKYQEMNSSSKVVLHITVSEGRRYYMGDFLFEGNKVYSDPQIASQFLLEKEEVFNYNLYKQSTQNMYSIYREEGYLFLQVKEMLDFKDSIVNVKFIFTEGKPASINFVHIAGNTTTRDKVIRREIRLFPGDTYRQSLMERSFREIMQLNYFDGVVPDVKVVGEQEVDLVFDVKEKEAGTGQFNAGVQYNAQEGVVGTFGVSIPNCCIGDGLKADLNVEYGPTSQNYMVGLSDPWFMDRHIGVGGSVNYTTYDYDDGRPDVTRYGFSGFVGKQLTWPDDYFYSQVRYNFQRNIQGDNNPGMIKNTGLESSVEFSLIRDDKDLPIFPRNGSRFKVSYLRAGLPFGGDFEFNQVDFSLKWWFPLYEKLSLKLHNDFGVIDGSAIQFRTLYLMGGSIGYRGQARGYGPGSIGRSQIGRSYYSFTSEVSYPVAEQQFYLLAFFDAGNVYGTELTTVVPEASELPKPWSEVDLTDLYKDYGFGFRIIIPMIGILGFDFAWPLDERNGLGTTGMQTNFVITQGF